MALLKDIQQGDFKMRLTRRGLLASATTVAAVPQVARHARAQARPVIKIGVLNDQSGPYRDLNGPTAVICTKLAVEEFNAQGFDVVVLDADHQNKPDIAVSIAKQWIDRDGVDVIMDCAASSCALALATIAREKDKVVIPTSTATSDLTGSACSPNTIHWVFDTYMTAKSTGMAVVKAGGNSWFFLTPNYAFGHSLQRDTTSFVVGSGGTVVGAAVYPFPETTDFSAQLVQARASGAKVLAMANGGSDLINSIKQAREFGLTESGMKLAAMLCYVTDIHTIGLQTAQGLLMTESYYWDLNDRTRSFQKRIQPRVKLWPNMAQAGTYSCTLHYLKAVADMGPAEAKKSGRATVERMKAMPTDDDCFGKGTIREDGRKIHPSYLFQVKKPSESKHEWDLLTLVSTTPADEAFRPLDPKLCSFDRKA